MVANALSRVPSGKSSAMVMTSISTPVMDEIRTT